MPWLTQQGPNTLPVRMKVYSYNDDCRVAGIASCAGLECCIQSAQKARRNCVIMQLALGKRAALIYFFYIPQRGIHGFCSGKAPIRGSIARDVSVNVLRRSQH
jgi:hypothetical protein